MAATAAPSPAATASAAAAASPSPAVVRSLPTAAAATDGSGGRGITSNGGVTVSGGTVNAKGGSGKNGNGGDGILSFSACRHLRRYGQRPLAAAAAPSPAATASAAADHVAISGGTVNVQWRKRYQLAAASGIISNDIDAVGQPRADRQGR
ncbi:MAG: hypothetical protein ACLTGJ_09385 [Faecalibacterium prausnitzii]